MFKIKEHGNKYKEIIDQNDQKIKIKAKYVELMSEIFSMKDKKYIRIRIEKGLKVYLEKLEEFCIENGNDTFIINKDEIIIKVPYRYNKLECIIRREIKRGERVDIDFEICGISQINMCKT